MSRTFHRRLLTALVVAQTSTRPLVGLQVLGLLALPATIVVDCMVGQLDVGEFQTDDAVAR